MAHLSEIVINAANVGLSLVIVILLLVLVRGALRQGLDTTGARLFLRKDDATRGLVMLLVGLVVFIVSNVLELYGDVFHIDWDVNEMIETLALAPMIAGLYRIHRILRLPSAAERPQTIEVSEARRG